MVFVTGGTGYLGVPLIEALLARGHRVRALVRPRSARRLPAGAEPVIGNALEAASYVTAIAPADAFVHLVGTPHPNPSKAKQFEEVDLASIRAAADAARRAGVRHFVYVSVAQPAPVMRAYIAVRQQGEALLRASGMDVTVLRPWYVLGPGHWWPYAFMPIYAALRRLPATREGARRLGFVTHRQMVAALVSACERRPEGVQILEVPEIERLSLTTTHRGTEALRNP